MEQINRCLEITEAKRAALRAFDSDSRHAERKAMIAERKAHRSADFGNRKARRREAALARKKGKEIA